LWQLRRDIVVILVLAGDGIDAGVDFGGNGVDAFGCAGFGGHTL